MSGHIEANMDINEYHNHPAISRSALMLFKKSPYHYWYQYLSGKYIAPKESDAFIFGNAVHTFLLEPEKMWDKFYVSIPCDRRTKVGKMCYEAQQRAVGNRSIINGDIHEALIELRDAVEAHKIAYPLIKDAEYERSIFWQDEDTGLQCKCRPDIWGNGYIADLKTTSNAAYDAFQRSTLQFGYDIQAAMIQEGIKHATGEIIENFILIAIEKEPPYAMGCYPLDISLIQDGVRKFKESLFALKHCMENNHWPGYNTQTLYAPNWV